MSTNKNQKGFAHLFILLVILLIGAGTWWIYSKNKLPTSQSSEKYYVGNIDQCELIEYDCPEGYVGFNDDKGCGCEMGTPVVYDSNISDWTTYKNDKYGFSFKHPSNSKLFEQQDNAIVILSVDDTVIPLTIADPKDNPDMLNTKDFVIDEYEKRKKLENEGETFGPVVMPVDVGPTTIGGQLSFQGTIPSFDHEKLLIYTPYKDKMFVFDYPYDDPNISKTKLVEVQELYIQILSTFEFID